MLKSRLKDILSVALCVALVAATAMLLSGCKGDAAKKDTSSVVSAVDGGALGDGKAEFTLTVDKGDGKKTAYKIKTDKKIVGDALQELGLIAGEQGEFGLYVKTVDGLTLDYDKDKMYWAFYINDGYAPTGVDTIEIKAGEVYSFVASK